MLNELKTAKGFLFDLNGTMVNDMPYHTQAWHHKIIALGGELTLQEMKYQCYGKNDELLERVFPGRFTLEEKIKIGNDKEAIYRIEFKPSLKLALIAFIAWLIATGEFLAIFCPMLLQNSKSSDCGTT